MRPITRKGVKDAPSEGRGPGNDGPMEQETFSFKDVKYTEPTYTERTQTGKRNSTHTPTGRLHIMHGVVGW